MEDNIFDKVHEVDLKQTMECYCVPCPAGCKRWFETGTEKNHVLYDRAEQRS